LGQGGQVDGEELRRAWQEEEDRRQAGRSGDLRMALVWATAFLGGGLAAGWRAGLYEDRHAGMMFGLVLVCTLIYAGIGAGLQAVFWALLRSRGGLGERGLPARTVGVGVFAGYAILSLFREQPADVAATLGVVMVVMLLAFVGRPGRGAEPEPDDVGGTPGK
jgi:hypothetical protein